MKAMRYIIYQIPQEAKDMNKKELRLKYKALRLQLSENEREERSLAIANKVLTLPIWEKTYFHIFLPITEHHEVNTEFILHLLSLIFSVT